MRKHRYSANRSLAAGQRTAMSTGFNRQTRTNPAVRISAATVVCSTCCCRVEMWRQHARSSPLIIPTFVTTRTKSASVLRKSASRKRWNACGHVRWQHTVSASNSYEREMNGVLMASDA